VYHFFEWKKSSFFLFPGNFGEAKPMIGELSISGEGVAAQIYA